MKVAFVIRDTLVHEFLGIEILSAALKERGHQVELFRSSRKNWVAKLKTFSPEILAFSVITGSHLFYINLCRQLKQEMSFFSVFGGPHPTFFPEIVSDSAIDAICIGEGELALPRLTDNLTEGKSVTDIPNIWTKSNSKIFRNDVGPFIVDLDKIPFPDRALIYKEDSFLKNSKMKFFLASRGCPYQCSYCFNEAYYKIYEGKGQRVRYRSVNNLISEIEAVRTKYPLELVRFIDDTFILDKEWVDEFCCEYKKKINLPFICNVRVNLINEDIAKKLKDACCKAVYMAIEAGNDTIRNEILRRNISKEQIRDAFQIMHQAGINVATENILGVPTETVHTVLETVSLNIEVEPDNAISTIFQPYPKTRLGEMAVRKGLFNGDFDKIYTSYFNKSPLKFKSKSEKRQIENMQKLFGIAVSFPWLLPAIKIAIKLPLGWCYNFVHQLWDLHCKRGKIFTLNLSIKDYILFAVRTIRYS